jgi:CRP-like cAMP-binding protein/Fe-S-cluster-containing dehydrogenase component
VTEPKRRKRFGFADQLVTYLKPVEDESTSTLTGIQPPNTIAGPLFCTKDDLILGEMTCLSHYPRSATIVARNERCELWEIRRNFLDMLRRNRSSRAVLETIYRERAIPEHLRKTTLFADLPEQERRGIIRYLKQPDVSEFFRVDPGQIIFEQGEPAEHFYLIRLGFVKVSQRSDGQERVLNYLGPDSHFGEIGLLTANALAYLPASSVARGLPEGFAEGIRTATCSALDDVELVRIRGEGFRHLIETFPTFREKMVGIAEELLRKDLHDAELARAPALADYLDQGLFNAEKLLVLDLQKCTRCDECTRACADTHDGVTRLIREGLRFGHFLVATSCRSCMDPYCLVGCPVDSIHRRPPTDTRMGLEIVIEDWCIGCGLCSSNCPYGNISMHPIDAEGRGAGRMKAAVRHKATTCDLCRSIVRDDREEVSCVYACPHDAAHRMSGQDLFRLVELATAPPPGI